MPPPICLIISGAYMNILFIAQVKILLLMEWSYSTPQSCKVYDLSMQSNVF